MNLKSVEFDRHILAILLFCVVVSSLLFIGFSGRPVFDDQYNLRDVFRYQLRGVSPATLIEHINPAGPLSYAWIGVIGGHLGGTLGSFRLVNAITVAGLGLILLTSARWSRSWAVALCALLVNPYLPLAAATVLTEAPALLAICCGCLLWLAGLEVISSGRLNGWVAGTMVIVGGALIGFSVVGRQYYIAALPAMAITCLCQKAHSFSFAKIGILLLSLVVAAVPTLLLFALWGGLASPSIRANISYANHTADIGFNFLRPISAVVYLGIYLLPLLVWQKIAKKFDLTRIALLALMFAAVLLMNVPLKELLCDGPDGCGPVSGVHTLAANYSWFIAAVWGGAIVTLGSVGVSLFASLIWFNRRELFKDSRGVFGLAFTVLFIFEQSFVGGNIPFFERYILQISPLVGLAIGAVHSFSLWRAMACSVPMVVYGFYRLWRFI